MDKANAVSLSFQVDESHVERVWLRKWKKPKTWFRKQEIVVFDEVRNVGVSFVAIGEAK